MKVHPSLETILLQQPVIAYILPLAIENAQSDVMSSLARVSEPYRRKFLENYVRYLENHSVPLEDVIYEEYSQYFVANRLEQSDNMSDIIYKNHLFEIVLAEDRFTLVKAGETSQRTWEAGRALSDYLIKHRLNPQFTVVELGSGCGLVGFTVAKLGVKKLHMTDMDVNAIERLHWHMERNGLSRPTQVETHELRWGSVVPSQLEGCDIVIAADVLYDPRCFIDFLDCLVALHPKNGAIVATAVRNPEAYNSFLTLCGQQYQQLSLTVLHDYVPETSESEYFYLSPGPRIEIIKIDLRPI